MGERRWQVVKPTMRYLNGSSTNAHPTNKLMMTVLDLASVLVISACGGSTAVTHHSFSVPQYESLNEVERTADISVVGTVTDEQLIVEDTGGNAQVDEVPFWSSSCQL